MKITIEVGDKNTVGRKADVRITASELASVYLHLAFPEKRNRTGLYMRRHPFGPGDPVNQNNPLRAFGEPPKIPIPAHIEEMRRKGMIPSSTPPVRDGNETFGSEPSMLAVPISDLVANLLRPCFHKNGFGDYKLFHFKDEPINESVYWCLCFFGEDSNSSRGKLEFRQIRFDTVKDSALDLSGRDLLESGLVWATALVPLVVEGKPLSAVEIAQNDYDLRQILGRDADKEIQYAYKGWFEHWNERVAEIVSIHQAKNRSFASFYHSVLAVDKDNNIHIRQMEATLPDLAKSLARDGMVAAGLLDSGGSCALYDVWMASYLNHFWYFREPRGGVLLFELKSIERIPLEKPGFGFHRRRNDIPKY